MITPLLASDHITGAFGRLAHRIAMMLEELAVIDIVAKLKGEGITPTDIRLALGAARVIRQDDWPLEIK